MIKEIEEPLVSINIPTYNEEKDLPFALKAIAKENYANIELIVIDSNSNDNTKKIASQFEAKVINYEGKLLGARYKGVKESNGDYILFLDADQILKKNAILRAVDQINDYDMLVLEEDSYKPKSYIQKKLCEERKLVHSQLNALDPITGGLLPRFFKKNLLEDVFKRIPKNLYNVIAGDHAIIYFEAYQISKKIGIVNDAVSHIEPESLSEFVTHFYKFGKSYKKLVKTGYYNELFSGKSLKENASKSIKNKIMIITLLRSFAFRMGYYFG